MGYVYFAQIDDAIKIGVTKLQPYPQGVLRRLTRVKKEYKIDPPSLLFCLHSTQAEWLEKHLHDMFAEYRIRPDRELFRLKDEHITKIKCLDSFNGSPIIFLGPNDKFAETTVRTKRHKRIIRPLNPQPTGQESPSAAQLPIMVLNDLENRFSAKFAALEQAKEEVKRSRQRDTLIYLLGFASGILLAVGLLAVAALMLR